MTYNGVYYTSQERVQVSVKSTVSPPNQDITVFPSSGVRSGLAMDTSETKAQALVMYQFLRFMTPDDRSYVDWLKVPNNAFQKPLAVELVISLSYMLSSAF